MPYPTADPYPTAIRGPLSIWYSVAAYNGDVLVAGADDLRPTGGNIVDTSKPGIRRTLNLDVAGGPDLYEALSPIGTELVATAHVRYTGRDVIDIPMGRFVVDAAKMSEGQGSISLTAPDQWVKIQRYRFITPVPSGTFLTVVQQIQDLVLGAIDWAGDFQVLTDATAMTPALVWEKDRDKAIIDLAESIGCWVYFDRLGVPTIAPVPTTGGSADWLVDASASGVLISLDRETSRAQTRNVVVVASSATDGERFPVQAVWDDDPFSPTYAGTDPIFNPASAGPFGIVTYYYDTPILATVDEARAAGRTILSRVSGLASQVSLSSVTNPAMDAFDVIDVLPPGQQPAIVGSGGGGFGVAPFGTSPFGASPNLPPQIRYVSTRSLERHVVDTLTHPLTMGAALQIDGRSTRTEEIAGGS